VKNKSIGKLKPCGFLGNNRSWLPATVIFLPGGIKNTWLGLICMPFSAINTGMAVCRASKLSIMLL
jgi:hypothetical protein